MMRSRPTQQSRSAFQAMIWTGLSACLIIVLASFAVSFTRPDEAYHDAPFKWTAIPSGTVPHPLIGKTLQYSINLNGVPAGDVEIAFARLSSPSAPENGVAIKYRAQTTSSFSWAYSWQTTGITWTDGNDMLPRVSCRHTIENGEYESGWMRFDRIRRSANYVEMESDDITPDCSELHFAHGFDWPTLFARLTDLRVQEGERPTFDVIDGDRAYVVQIINTGQRDPVAVESGTYPSRKLRIVVTRLAVKTDDQNTSFPQPNLAYIWVENRTHLPLKAQYRSPLGRITATLTSDVPRENDK